MRRKNTKFFLKAIVAIAIALAFIMPGSAAFANFETTGKETTSVNNNIFDNNIESVVELADDQGEDDIKDSSKIIDLEESTGSGVYDVESPDVFDIGHSKVLLKSGHLLSNTPKPSGGKGITIYVDDDFIDDPPNHKWDTIQEGIDDASAGDTVRVYDGFYNEYLIVDKSIDLIGNGSSSTIIDGGNIYRIDAMLVVADWVNISGFGIQNAGDDCIELDSQNNHVMDCELYDSAAGIFSYYADYNTIENCVCHDNIYGIYFSDSANGKTLNCLCHNNSNVGIWFDDSDYATVSWCTVNTCEYGVRIENSDDSSMDNCSVSNNEYGTFLYSSEDCILRDNQHFNNIYGFGLYGEYVEDIDTSNTVNGKPIYLVMNQNDLVFDETMNIGYLCVVNCDNITIQNIELSDVMYGVQIEELSTNCRVTNCEIHDIYHTGIWVGDDSDHRIDNCTIYNVPAYAGIYVKEDTTIVENCEVYNHGHFGIYVSDPYDDVINCSVHDGEMGIRVSDKNILVKDCEVWNNSDSGIFCYSRTGIVLRNNTIWNSTENFGILPSSVSYLLGMDIDTSNTVNGKPIYFLRSQADLVLDETMSVGWVGLVSCTNITVKNLHFPGFYDGMILANSDCHIYNCSVTGCHYGFLVYDCDNELVLENCTAYDNNIATQLQKSEGNTITGYTAYNNKFGLWIHSSSENNVLRNCNLHDNTYNFASRGLNAGDYHQDIDTSNLVDGKPIYYIMDQNNMTFDDTMNIGFLGLVSCEYMLVENLVINNEDYGVLLVDTTYSQIINCSFNTHYISCISLNYNSDNNLVKNCILNGDGGNYGISLYKTSDGNTITNCTVYDTGLGVRGYEYSTNHVIEGCTFYDNSEGIYLYKHSNYNTIINCSASGGDYGFDIYNTCDYNDILNCQIYDNDYGIDLYATVDNNRVENCSIYNNSAIGIRCYKCTDGTIANNMFLENFYGIYAHTTSNNNQLHHNNFINNGVYRIIEQAHDECTNIWDDDIGEGNYWSDYTGIDDDGNGIGDTPYNISGGSNQDRYPLMESLQTIPALLSPIDTVGIEDQTPTFDWTDIWHSCLVSYTLQVATDPGFTSIVINEAGLVESEYTPLTNLPFDTYYWRVRAILSDDVVMDWSETWSFFIALDLIPPTTPDLIEPTDGSTLVMTPAIFFDWTDAYDLHGIDYYTLQIATDVNFVNIVFDITPDDSDYTLTLTTPDDYYWRVQAVDNNGLPSSWSNVWMFTRLADTDPPVVELLYPVGGEYLNGDVIILWDATDDITPNVDLPITIEYRCGGPWQILASGEVNDGEYLWDTTGYPDGILYKIRISTEDFWGNIGSDESYATFTVDNTDPLTTAYLNPASPDGENDWYVSNVCITLVATDETSGIDYTMYMIDNSGSWEEYVVPVTVSEDGEHTVEFYSVDNAGNEEAVGEVTFKIDKTVPTIDLTWDEENSKLVADVDDETSDVAMVEFYVNGELIGEVTSPPYEMEYDASSGDTAYAIVYDNAGNSAESEIIESSQGNLQSQTNPVLTRILQRYTMLKI